MPEKFLLPDCCERPDLEMVKSFRKTAHDVESVCRCRSCGRHWYYRMHEFATRDEQFDRRIWYASLTEEEVSVVLTCEGQVDVSFLWEKPGVLQDDEGIKRLPKKPPISSQ
jgi:hypothetical protein